MVAGGAHLAESSWLRDGGCPVSFSRRLSMSPMELTDSGSIDRRFPPPGVKDVAS